MIVIPMAGLSKRFMSAGYAVPKYMLEADGKSLFFFAVNSFKRYFSTEEFLFVCLDVQGTPEFVESEARAMGIEKYRVVVLKKPTRGQAETVYLGVQEANVDVDQSLIIFNIDTFRPGFKFPHEFNVNKIDGYLETFVGSGKNWSNVLPSDRENYKVEITAEKQEISEFCCTGLYFWGKCSDFCSIFEGHVEKGLDAAQAGEFYIAPMYNDLIKKGGDVRYSVIDQSDVIFCGVPSEYEGFLKRFQ